MLIDINLLPEKETKSKSLLLLAIISIVILLIGGFFAFWLNRSHENKLSSIEKEITATEEIVAIEQQKMTSYQSSDSLAQLEQTIEWAKQYPIKTVPIIKELTKLLPERGFIQTFNYTETGTIQLSVQFESTREAAYFLNSLHQWDWLEDAKMSSVNAETGFFDKQMGESERDESELANEKYVPRYIAEIELTLNKELIKSEVVSPSSDEKEGEDS
ncbi:PilN domain-containing protein [Niallia endozanthoxylica]|uniref:Fimbrial assembly family protein n=1 Tax=Niallia endozanthoxylica TaxID=2036016 RepID=A0A5J5HSL0_9BACI|nr:hypothetical protein [Niallia endozanthoxylica]KAA9023133.1 hypothetical protein F4V44_13610 [Niallia endozanthoxylica]